jgi:TIR domain
MASLFVSHASEDKATVVRPLAERLRSLGEEVWYDEYVLTIGDSLAREIDAGLARCDFGVVVLSPSFFEKEWPRKELDALFAREALDRQKRILPVWHNLDATAVAQHSPLLAARLGVPTSKGIDAVVSEIQRAVSRGSIASFPSPSTKTSTAQAGWNIGVTAPTLGLGEDGKGGLRLRAKTTFVNRSTRAAVLSFQLRYDLEPGDARQWVAIPEGENHENERLRVEAEGFAVRELVFHFVNPGSYGGLELFRNRQAHLWITDHIANQKALVRLPISE